jgi:hypothetical protein
MIQGRAVVEWEKELRGIERDIEDYVKELKKAPDKVKKFIYDEISGLQDRETELRAKIQTDPLTGASFEQVLGEAIRLISNPRHMWQVGDLDRKRLVQKMVFPQRLSYVYRDNFRKPAIALPFRVCEGLAGQKDGLVEVNGIEPMTSCLQSKCSTN